MISLHGVNVVYCVFHEIIRLNIGHIYIQVVDGVTEMFGESIYSVQFIITVSLQYLIGTNNKWIHGNNHIININTIK